MSERQTTDERFLVLAPTGRDGPLTVSLLERAGLVATTCASMSAMCRLALDGAAGLLVAEEVLVPKAIAELAQLLQKQPPWSDLPIILFTGEGATIQARTPTPALLAPFGNVVLLDRPLRPLTVVSAVRSALRARFRQYAAREVMAAQELEVRQRDQFLAMLGHELRNPLGVILLAAEMLGRGDPEKQKEIIKRQGRHLARLVDDLLDVARVTSGKVVLQRRPIELNETLERAIATVHAATEAQRQSIVFAGAGEDVIVAGDPVRLDQIFGNLLTNAVKYTPAGGRIVVNVEADPFEARVRVADNGLGIPADMLPRVFDLFTQAERTLDRSQGGLGIGLTLVRSLVGLHGGKVAVTSAGVGLGSEFTVVLPRRTGLEDLPSGTSPRPALPPATMRVVLVEDNRDSRDLMKTLLEMFGHEVETAADGEEGVARVLASKPDAVIVDIGLPKLDGYDVARRVRSALGDGVLLVAVTGYSQPDDRRRALDAGFDAHYAKPIDPHQLQRLLWNRREAAR